MREIGAYGGDPTDDRPPETTELHFLKVTGPISSGFYPASRYDADSSASDFGDAQEDAWLWASNDELLTKRIWYPSKLFGNHPTDGLAVYVPVLFQQTLGGKLDATLNYHSSATMSVWGNSGGSGAAGTSNRTADVVSSVTITNAGSGYYWAPTVTFSGGGGAGAAGIAVIDASGTVTSVTITSGGSGYTSDPTVAFDAEADTGDNITVYDATILSSGQSVAVGKFITAYYDMMSCRYKLLTSQCV